MKSDKQSASATTVKNETLGSLIKANTVRSTGNEIENQAISRKRVGCRLGSRDGCTLVSNDRVEVRGGLAPSLPPQTG